MKMYASGGRQVIVATAIVLAGAGVAGAQDPELPSGRTPGWSFTPGMSIAGVYDTNVALAAESPVRRQSQSDRLVVAAPFAQLDFTSKRTELSTGYQGYLRRYVDLSQLDGFDQHGHASVRRLVSKRVTFAASNDYVRVPTTDELEVNGVPFSRTGAHRNALVAQLDARVGKFTDFSVKYDNTWIRFDRTESLLTGGMVHAISTHLTRRVRDRVAVGGEYAVRFADLNEGTRQLTFHDLGGVAQLGFAPRTTLSLGAGVSLLDDRSLNVSRTGPYFRADVTHGTEHAIVGASFERAFVPSFGFGGSSQSQQARGFIRMPLDRNRMYYQGSVSWRRTNPFIENELPLNTTLLRSTVGYSATRYLRLEGFHAFTRQNSGVPGGQVNRHRIGAQVVISQPMRIQ
jgi:hypothetical protein